MVKILGPKENALKVITDAFIIKETYNIIDSDSTIADYLIDCLSELNCDGGDKDLVDSWGNGDIKEATTNIEKFYIENYNYKIKPIVLWEN